VLDKVTPARNLCAALGAALVMACTSVPEQFQGEYPPVEPVQVGVYDIGLDIRWGGVILETRAGKEETCFEILSRELSKSMRPRNTEQTAGRFIACKEGFHDPEVFAKGREITLTGRISAMDTRKVDEFDYRYPVVDAYFVTMWPKRPDVVVYNRHDPFYNPWYWGSFYYPYPYHGHYYRRPYSSTTVRSGAPSERVDIPERQ
jgi:outer membrane lipoprotein